MASGVGSVRRVCRRREAVEGLLLQGEIGMQVDLVVSVCSWPSQSAMTVVSTPACSRAIAQLCRRVCGVMVLPVREGGHGRRRVWRRAAGRRRGTAGAAAGGEQDVAGVWSGFGQPGAQHGGGAGQRVIRSLRPLPSSGRARRAQVQVLNAQAGQLGHPEPGLGGQGEQGMVAPAEPAAAVGRGEQRVGLGRGEVVDDGPVAAFGRDRQDPGDRRRRRPGRAGRRSGTGIGSRPAGRCGWSRRCPARSPGESGTPRSRRRPDRRCPGRRAVCRCVGGVADQQPQAVPVGGDGVRAGLPLPRGAGR